MLMVMADKFDWGRSFMFQGTITGTVFLNLPQSTTAYFSRGGILFLWVLL
jgi:hypothetical protein